MTGNVAAALLLIGSPLAAGTETPATSTLDWSACTGVSLRDGGFDCTRLSVPMDRRVPAGPQFSLAIARHRSTGTPAERIGSLLFNPGGPGASGVSYLDTVWDLVPEQVRQRFDLVTWDPRGVGESTPALTACDAPWPPRPVTGVVDWAQVVRDFRRVLATANRACQQANAAIIGHVGTVENVEDLDRMRNALGEEQLNFWGMSYGTRIGYVYALKHPDRVRAIILDGSIDPAATTLALAQGGAAPDQAFGPFAAAYPVAARQLGEVLAVLDDHAVPLADGSSLTRWDVRDLVYGQVAQQSAYSVLAQVIGWWHTAIFGTGPEQAQALQESLGIKRSVSSLPNSNAGALFSAVNCLDYAGRPTLAQATRSVGYQSRLAPEYGASLATMFALGCSGLTIDPDPVPVIVAAGPKVPVLVLGSSRDGSTIVQWTTRMSRAFPASRTVTYAGGQHVTWGFAGSSCVDEIANDYVINVRLPSMDRACPNAFVPAG